LLIDRHDVGASFDRWPEEMRFITPSFPTNSMGMLDLNSIAIGTSPAYSLGEEHPSGSRYAGYLRAVARHFRLRTKKGVDVSAIAVEDGGFLLQTTQGNIRANYVVWAAGEFQYPRARPFPGAELCLHNSQVASWRDLEGEEFLIIGGYESGIDSAIQLARLGKRVTVLERSPVWDLNNSDPSVVLSPYTLERLRAADVESRIRRAAPVDVVEVRRWGSGFEVGCRSGQKFRTRSAPILATGFTGSQRLIRHLFAERDDGYPLLSASDESTLTPGLFLAGPLVRHEGHIFCFIYKYRQRFAVVARAIAVREGLDQDVLESYRQWGMLLDDLSCCGQQCEC
jgi:thioredoxin reductase